ncbi:MAG: HEAT repeat domain-containing protein [Planctomycetota bacterium]|jgi:hypothetical protein
MNVLLRSAPVLATVAVLLVLPESERSDGARARSIPANGAQRVRDVRQPGTAATVAQRTDAETVGPRIEDSAVSRSTPQLRGDVLSALRRTDLDPTALHEASTHLVAILRRSPASVPVVVARVLEGDTGTLEAGRLLSCLATAGTDACQRGILTVVEATETDGARRLQALRSLAAVAEPDSDVDVVLGRLVDTHGPLGWEARIVWASVAGCVRERDPSRADAVGARVREWLEVASDSGELRVALEAFGNLGPAEAPLRVLDAVRATDENVRAAAVRALRHVDSQAAEDAIVRSMRDDQCESVRLCALEVLANRQRRAGWAQRSAIRDVAQADPAEHIRRRAEELLATFEHARSG